MRTGKCLASENAGERQISDGEDIARATRVAQSNRITLGVVKTLGDCKVGAGDFFTRTHRRGLAHVKYQIGFSQTGFTSKPCQTCVGATFL